MGRRVRARETHYMTRDRRQMELWGKAMLPLQFSPTVPRSVSSPFGTALLIKARARRVKPTPQHPAFDDTIPVDEEIR
jgi:hypothetical protein